MNAKGLKGPRPAPECVRRAEAADYSFLSIQTPVSVSGEGGKALKQVTPLVPVQVKDKGLEILLLGPLIISAGLLDCGQLPHIGTWTTT